jgi:hypothetical protein
MTGNFSARRGTAKRGLAGIVRAIRRRWAKALVAVLLLPAWMSSELRQTRLPRWLKVTSITGIWLATVVVISTAAPQPPTTNSPPTTAPPVASRHQGNEQAWKPTLPPTPAREQTTSVPTGASQAQAAPACRAGDPKANVYHPDRLEVISPCATVSGTVGSAFVESYDGDYHIDLALDAASTSKLTALRGSQVDGTVLIEVVPADAPGCTIGQPPRPAHGSYDYGTCTGASIPLPLRGSPIEATGPYVWDHKHGWDEIHPAWVLRVLGPGVGAVAAPASLAPSTKPAPIGASGTRCSGSPTRHIAPAATRRCASRLGSRLRT